MSKFRVGIIGCGRPGRGQGRAHAKGYKSSPDCEIVAAADIVKENLDLFCQEFAVPHGYLDHREMLAKEQLDIVSVCAWPEFHAPIVVDAARAGVKAIHCEKPMATTWGDAKKMAAICEEQHVQLTIGHQRRYGKPFQKAKELLDGGAIGQLTRLEAFTHNLYDWGTHWFDMMFFYNNEQPAEWVMGQIEPKGGRSIFNVQHEGQGLSFLKWRNGVYGLMVTGKEIMGAPDDPTTRPPCENRLIGAEGVIEVAIKEGQGLRLRNIETGGHWRDYDVGSIHGVPDVISAVLATVEALKTGRESLISARKALQAVEVIFATYESSRRRGRVNLPLDIEDSPFHAMLAAGVISAG